MMEFFYTICGWYVFVKKLHLNNTVEIRKCNSFSVILHRENMEEIL